MPKLYNTSRSAHGTTKHLPRRLRKSSYPHAGLGPAIPEAALPEDVETLLQREGPEGQDEDGYGIRDESPQLLRSPLMSRGFLEAREQFRRPKKKPRKSDLTPAQCRLAQNPYGRS